MNKKLTLKNGRVFVGRLVAEGGDEVRIRLPDPDVVNEVVLLKDQVASCVPVSPAYGVVYAPDLVASTESPLEGTLEGAQVCFRVPGAGVALFTAALDDPDALRAVARFLETGEPPGRDLL